MSSIHSLMQVAMAVNFFRAGVPAKEVALGALGSLCSTAGSLGSTAGSLRSTAATQPPHYAVGTATGCCRWLCLLVNPHKAHLPWTIGPCLAGLFRPTLPAGAIGPMLGALGALVMPYNLVRLAAAFCSHKDAVKQWGCMEHTATLLGPLAGFLGCPLSGGGQPAAATLISS